jgi:nucleoside-diphosphate-sugar epimerase
MKIIVTGGQGYIGTHVRQYFGADDFSRRSHLDVNNPLDARTVSDYDVVIHLAAHLDKSPSAAQSCFQTNADGTANIIRHMRPGSVIIYASTKDVYGPYPDNWDETPETCLTDYAGQTALEWSKLIGERYIDYYAAQQDIRSCIFRLSTIYAPVTEGNEYGFVNHYLESVQKEWPISLPGNGLPIRDILYVDDFSRACRAFIDSDIKRALYNLGGGRQNAVKLSELVEIMGRVTAKTPVIDPDTSIPMPKPQNYISEMSRIEHELGWRPEIGIEEGIRKLL